MKYGQDKLPIKHKLNAALVTLKYKLKFEDLYHLFGKYVGNWGDLSIKFKFEGYKNDELVKTVVKAPVFKPTLSVKADTTELIHGDTYDATRIVIKCVDEHGNDCTYAFDSIRLEARGVEIIGPKNINLIGGSTGFWIKSIKKGTGSVRISNVNLGEEVLEFETK